MRSRLQWAGHVERMADDSLPKRAAELREEGRRRRGRPRLGCEDCVKRDVKKAGEVEDWRKTQKTEDRGKYYNMRWLKVQLIPPPSHRQRETRGR